VEHLLFHQVLTQLTREDKSTNNLLFSQLVCPRGDGYMRRRG